MKNASIILYIVLCISACTQEKSQYPALEFIGLYQLDSLHGQKFDLSGIVEISDSIYVIADKPWNKFLYKIGFSENSFTVLNRQNLSLNAKLDLEGVDECDGMKYLVNERRGTVYSYKDPKSISTHKINLDSMNMNAENWGNAGWEGIAVDCSNKTAYLLKEREPRNIFVARTDNWKIIDAFNIPETESNDFSDAKFENGHLYVIERNGFCITKIDPNTKEVVSKYQYQNIANHSLGKLYGPTDFGMAEALLLTNDEIWVGLDNNGLRVTKYAEKVYGMSGKSPTIIKFKRPIGF